jgi:hypothetical protein
MNRRSILASAALAAALNGCAQARHVEVMTVLANGNCQTTEIGVRAIDYATLATFRGTRLIGMTESEQSTSQPLHLIAIVPGEFPTAGYGVSLREGTALTADVLTIKIKTDRPSPEAVLAQMITHPCLVVGIADPAVARVKVLDDSAAVLGEVDLARSKEPPKTP